MRVLLQFVAHPRAIRCFQLPFLRPSPLCCCHSIRVFLSEEKVDTYNQGNQWARSKIRKKATYTETWSALGEMPWKPPVPLPCQVYVCSANWSSDTGMVIPVCRQYNYVLRCCISGRNAMVYLVHQWWPATKKRGHSNLKLSTDDGYRLHFLVPGGHIGSPIIHVKHHARWIPYSKNLHVKPKMKILSLAVSGNYMTILRNPTWRR